MMASHGVARATTVISPTEQQRLAEQREINEYKELENLVRIKAKQREYTPELFELTSKLLRKNPEYYTIWNIRRRLLIHGLFSSSYSPSLEEGVTSPLKSPSNISSNSTHTPSEEISLQPINEVTKNKILRIINSDLDFLFPIMMKFPKCYWLWNYRLWLLEQGNQRLDLKTARELWKKELHLVAKMLVKDSRNFHGWGYRRMVVSQLECSRLDGKSMVESEFQYTTKMIHAPNGLSNFSAWHRRSILIPRLLDERNSDASARRQFLENELELIISAIYTDSYPYQQSAWFYYQFLMTNVTESRGFQITKGLTSGDRCEYIRQQLEILQEMLDGAEDCKWIYIAAIDYTFTFCQMEQRDISLNEKTDCIRWLTELKKIDSFRMGRWNDLEKELIMFTR